MRARMECPHGWEIANRFLYKIRARARARARIYVYMEVRFGNEAVLGRLQ